MSRNYLPPDVDLDAVVDGRTSRQLLVRLREYYEDLEAKLVCARAALAQLDGAMDRHDAPALETAHLALREALS